MSKKIDFTKDDKYAIAEYVFSYQSDVLIKSDAIAVIDVFEKHGLITEVDDWKDAVEHNRGNVSTKLADLVENSISNEQGTEIMDEYYGKSKT